MNIVLPIPVNTHPAFIPAVIKKIDAEIITGIARYDYPTNAGFELAERYLNEICVALPTKHPIPKFRIAENKISICKL